MAKAPKKPPNEDEAQSKRFTDLAHELEAAGDLSLTDAEAAFNKVIQRVVTPVRGKTKP